MDLGTANTAAITQESPYSGFYSADLCDAGATNCMGAFRQTIHVPAHVQSATISGWLKGTSSDEIAECSTFVGVIVANPNDPSDNAGVNLCEDELDGQWHFKDDQGLITEFLKAHEGQDVWVEVAGLAYDESTVEEETGSFFVDDVTLSITTAPVVTYQRSVGLTLKKHLKAQGTLKLDAGGPGACFKNATVKIQKKVDGVWKAIGSDTTDSTGFYAKGIPDKPGKYRTLAPKFKATDTKICAKTVSAVKTHSH
jgi:hypothetical protein